MTDTTATYTKLKKENTWGIKITGEGFDKIAPGTVLDVKRKDGSLREETIAKVVYKGTDFALATIQESIKAKKNGLAT